MYILIKNMKKIHHFLTQYSDAIFKVKRYFNEKY